MKVFINLMFSLFILFGTLPSYANDTTPSYFINGTINEVMKKAGDEGKLYFVDFYADWCTPCKWMDKTVFSDDQVKHKLTDNYIPIKVNIDDLDGFELKQKYKIGVLPTFIIFNSSGEMVDRVEETLNVDELLEILALHDNPDNKVRFKHSMNVAPGSRVDHSSRQKITEAYKRYKRSENDKNKKFRLQMGIFYDYESASEQVEALQQTFLDPIIVLNDMIDSRVRFKILLGEFESIQEARGFQNILEDQFSLSSIID